MLLLVFVSSVKVKTLSKLFCLIVRLYNSEMNSVLKSVIWDYLICHLSKDIVIYVKQTGCQKNNPSHLI